MGIYSSEQTDRDYVTDAVLFRAARVAVETGIPWDPFNIQLLVKALNEPKPYKCTVCGATNEAHLCD